VEKREREIEGNLYPQKRYIFVLKRTALESGRDFAPLFVWLACFDSENSLRCALFGSFRSLLKIKL